MVTRMAQTVIAVLVMTGVAGLVGCNRVGSSREVARTNTHIVAAVTQGATGTPQPAPTALLPEPGDRAVWWPQLPRGIAECGLPAIKATPWSSPLDRIVPGQTSQADVLALLGPQTEKVLWKGNQKWWYESHDGWVVLRDGVVTRRTEPRELLSEIVAKYGAADQVIWVLPKFHYHEAQESTYLLNGAHGLLCTGIGRMIWLTPDDFFFCDMVIPDDLCSSVDDHGILVDTEWDWSVAVGWPCTETP